MKRSNTMNPAAFLMSAGLLAAALGGSVQAAPCSPCAPRSRTTRSANPCAAKKKW